MTAPPPPEFGYRRVVAVEPLANAAADNGWTGRVTTVSPAGCPDAEMLQASQAHHTTVDPGLRWLKHPAASSPGWLENPERIAA
jgi:hypothetical protein